MNQEPHSFQWTPESERAAQLVAEASLSVERIADEVGVGRTTLYRWRRHPDFKARVKEARDEICESIRSYGISIVENRVRALNDRWNRLRRVIEDRADDPRMEGIPGGRTGLLVRTQKALGSGENMTIVDEYAVDTGLLRELREHEKQAAQELGQWAEKVEHSGPGGEPIPFAQVVAKAYPSDTTVDPS